MSFTLWINSNSRLAKDIASSVESILLERGVPVEKITPIELQAHSIEKTSKAICYISELLNRNNIAVITSFEAEDDEIKNNRSKINLIETSFSKNKNTKIHINEKDDKEASTKKIISNLELMKLIPSETGNLYSSADEEKVKQRLKDLGYL